MIEHPENSEEYKGLTVNAGIEQPSTVNPYLKLRKKPKRKEYTVDEFVDGIVKGNMTILSQAQSPWWKASNPNIRPLLRK